MKSLRRFIDISTTRQQEALAKASGSSRAYLYQLASGRRSASAEKAAAIERASRKLRTREPALPIVDRRDLCAACGGCDLARRPGR